MKLLFQFCALVSLLTLGAACANIESPTTNDLASNTSDAGIRCRVTVSSGGMNCDSPTVSARGVALNVVFGGPQNVYATLVSNTPGYNAGNHTFSVSVKVTNQSAQAMGTTDGTTPNGDGVRVFFFAQPTTTSGSGTVLVIADGSGTFTSASQPYYQYPGPLAPGASTADKIWTFDVPNTVTTFSFSVGISTKLPDEAGVLRWAAQTVGTEPLDEIAEACGDMWAVGGTAEIPGPPVVPGTGVIEHYSGTTWAVQTNPTPNHVLHSVEMVCDGGTATGVAVGEDGTILSYNGTTWSNVSPGGTGTLMSVGRAGSEWWACGLGGVITHSATPGGPWAQQNSNTTNDLFVCGGPAASNVYAAGANGFLTHYSGTTWDPTGYSSGFTATTIRAAAVSGSEMWLLGDGGTITHSTNGTIFNPQTSGTVSNLYGAQNFGSAVDLYAVGGNGRILNYNGAAWSTQFNGLGTTDIINDVIVRSGSGATFLDAWAVGNAGLVLHGTR